MNAAWQPMPVVNVPPPSRPVRVLHVLGYLGYGGIEIWLMNLLRAIDRTAFQFNFAVHTREPGPLNDEALSLGSRILPIDASTSNPLSYARNLRRMFTSEGPFDVVHSHMNSTGGLVLRVAADCGVRYRIAHCHANLRLVEGEVGIFRRGYYRLNRRWIKRYATAGLACSQVAATTMFGKRWSEDPRWRVLRCGIDFSKFAALPDRATLRHQLGLPNVGPILGQVARLTHYKNHEFTLRVFRELVKSQPEAHLLLVGGGELETTIRGQLREYGLSERATMAGDQRDVAPFLGAMDCMIFPSRHEGLGIVALEAQAAGVPTLASDRVPLEAGVIPGMVEHLPLTAPLLVWSKAVERRFAEPASDRRQMAAQMSQSEFSIQQSMEKLCEVYRATVRNAAC